MAKDPRASMGPGSGNPAAEVAAAKAKMRTVWIVGFAVWLASMLFLAASPPAPWMREYSVPVSVIPAAIAVYVVATMLRPKSTK
jgi:hypothetical protein